MNGRIVLGGVFAGFLIVSCLTIVVFAGSQAVPLSRGQPLSVVLKEAPEGLAVYQLALSVNSGTINGVNVWPLTGIGVEIAPDHKSVLITEESEGYQVGTRISGG